MGKGNNVVPNGHAHKSIKKNVKSWSNQQARLKRRREERLEKTEELVSGVLRPVVRETTFQHNTKVRAGRGFTLLELETANVDVNFAKTVGISVDYRRRNKSQENLQLNVQRLKEYLSKLVIIPKTI